MPNVPPRPARRAWALGALQCPFPDRAILGQLESLKYSKQFLSRVICHALKNGGLAGEIYKNFGRILRQGWQRFDPEWP